MPSSSCSEISYRPHPSFDGKFQFLSVRIPIQFPNVTVVSLSRPKKINAINRVMWREIGLCFDTIGKLGDGCRCIILTSCETSKGFCSGLDIGDGSFFSNIVAEGKNTDTARRGIMGQLPIIRDMQECFTKVEQCPIPVISIVHGICFGAGIDLICCTDIRYCTSDAKFSIREVKIGLAADIGTLQRLPKIAGNDSLVRELCYTGQTFGEPMARHIGLVSNFSNIATTKETLLERVLNTVCKTIVSNSPMAVVGTKKSLLYSRDHSVSEGLDHIATYNALALMTDDIPNAVAAAQSQKQLQPQEAASFFTDIPKYSRL